MYYIIQILAVILIGTAVASLIGQRNTALFIGSIVGIAFGVATLVVTAWWVLWTGTVAFLIGHALQRPPREVAGRSI